MIWKEQIVSQRLFFFGNGELGAYLSERDGAFENCLVIGSIDIGG